MTLAMQLLQRLATARAAEDGGPRFVSKLPSPPI
jgi:hypothetical protein